VDAGTRDELGHDGADQRQAASDAQSGEEERQRARTNATAAVHPAAVFATPSANARMTSVVCPRSTAMAQSHPSGCSAAW
jgi:hypothetical protein